MNPYQKIAWYNLTVIALAMAAYLILFMITGHPWGSTCVFGLLGFLGFGPLFLKKRKGEVLYDERDKDIAQKAQKGGFFLFWLYFVAACVLIPFYNDFKDVSSLLFFGLSLVGFILLLATQSVATLVLYRKDSEKAGAFLDSFRDMSDLQKTAWIGLIIISFVITGFLWFFPVGIQDPAIKLFGVIVMISFGAVFFTMRRSWKVIEMDRNEGAIARRAQQVGLLSLGIAVAAGGLRLAAFYAAGGDVSFNMVCFAGLCAFAAGILAQPVYIIVQYMTAAPGEKDPGMRRNER